MMAHPFGAQEQMRREVEIESFLRHYPNATPITADRSVLHFPFEVGNNLKLMLVMRLPASFPRIAPTLQVQKQNNQQVGATVTHPLLSADGSCRLPKPWKAGESTLAETISDLLTEMVLNPPTWRGDPEPANVSPQRTVPVSSGPAIGPPPTIHSGPSLPSYDHLSKNLTNARSGLDGNSRAFFTALDDEAKQKFVDSEDSLKAELSNKHKTFQALNALSDEIKTRLEAIASDVLERKEQDTKLQESMRDVSDQVQNREMELNNLRARMQELNANLRPEIILGKLNSSAQQAEVSSDSLGQDISDGACDEELLRRFLAERKAYHARNLKVQEYRNAYKL